MSNKKNNNKIKKWHFVIKLKSFDIYIKLLKLHDVYYILRFGKYLSKMGGGKKKRRRRRKDIQLMEMQRGKSEIFKNNDE